MPLHLLRNNHLRALIALDRSRVARRRRHSSPTGTPRRIMADVRLVLRIVAEIVKIARLAAAAHHQATTTPALLLCDLASPCGAVGALHRAQGVGALLAGVGARVADLRACDDGFAAHGAEAGEEGGEEGAQAGDCRGHDGVEDFGLAADGGWDAVESFVGGGELSGEVVDLEGGEGDYPLVLSV